MTSLFTGVLLLTIQFATAQLACPDGSTQIGGANADIAGCGLESCDDRYSIASIEECQDKCIDTSDCLSFSWAPLGGDKNHLNEKVCTIYDTTTSTGTWSPEQILCAVLECPTGSTQIGDLNADIGGCGLESCDDRYSISSLEDCYNKCNSNSNCLSFSWAPLGGDKNHANEKVCTIYDTTTATGTWSPRQILCEMTQTSVYFVGTSAMSFDAAVSYCEDAGGLIASIPTEEDWEEAVETANGLNVWIGLQDDTTYDNDMVWSWTDGTDIASNFGFNADRSATTGQGPWNTGEPNEYLGWEEDCVELYDTGKYNDISCEDSNYPLCKERYYLGTEAVKFQEAKTYCEEQGDVLAIIPTEAHWEAAKRVANGNEVWIGLRDEIRGEEDMIWFWIDNSDITDSFGFNSDQTATTGEGPWSSGEPNEYLGTDEDCVEMYTDGYYNDIPCRGYDHLPLCMVVIDEPCYADVCSVEELEDYCTANSKVVSAPPPNNNVPYNDAPYNGFENQEWFVQYMDGFKQTLDANMMAIMILFTLVNVAIGVASCYINAKMCRKKYTKVVQYDIATDEEVLK